jgi:hypothetical protein
LTTQPDQGAALDRHLRALAERLDLAALDELFKCGRTARLPSPMTILE